MIYELTEIENIKDKRVVLLNSGGLESCYLACLLSKYGFEIDIRPFKNPFGFKAHFKTYFCISRHESFLSLTVGV